MDAALGDAPDRSLRPAQRPPDAVSHSGGRSVPRARARADLRHPRAGPHRRRGGRRARDRPGPRLGRALRRAALHGGRPRAPARARRRARHPRHGRHLPGLPRGDRPRHRGGIASAPRGGADRRAQVRLRPDVARASRPRPRRALHARPAHRVRGGGDRHAQPALRARLADDDALLSRPRPGGALRGGDRRRGRTRAHRAVRAARPHARARGVAVGRLGLAADAGGHPPDRREGRLPHVRLPEPRPPPGHGRRARHHPATRPGARDVSHRGRCRAAPSRRRGS